MPTGNTYDPAQLAGDGRTLSLPAFAPDRIDPPATGARGHTPRRLSGFAPDYMIGNYVPTAREYGTPVALPDAYAGTYSVDCALDASRIRATVQPDSAGFAVDDTLITRNGIAHYVRSRSPNVVRYPDGDVAIPATIEVAQTRKRIRQSTEGR